MESWEWAVPEKSKREVEDMQYPRVLQKWNVEVSEVN